MRVIVSLRIPLFLFLAVATGCGKLSSKNQSIELQGPERSFSILAIDSEAVDLPLDSAVDESVVDSVPQGLRQLDYVIGAVKKGSQTWKYTFRTNRRDVIRLAAHWRSQTNYDLELWSNGQLLKASRQPGKHPEELEYLRAPAGIYTLRLVRKTSNLPADVVEAWAEYASRGF